MSAEKETSTGRFKERIWVMRKDAFTDEQLEILATLSADGVSNKDIAEYLGKSISGVGYQVNKMKINNQGKNNQTKAKMDARLKELFDAGCGDDQIALEMGIAENTVRHKRSGLGLKRRIFTAGEGFYLGEMIMGARRKALCEVWK